MITRPLVASNTLAFLPSTAPCPRCGAMNHCCQKRTRELLAADLHGPNVVRVTFSCFICPNHPAGERWYTALPSDLADQSRYTVPTRALMLSLVVTHKMSFQQASDFGRTHFHLAELEPATVMRWLRAGQPTAEALAARRQALVARFSGQLAIDEVYSNGKALIKATDPLVGEEIAYEFAEGSVDHDVIVAFFRSLKAIGIEPTIVTTDGASVYPAAIAVVWPDAKHQSCVFHFLQGWTKRAMKAIWHCLSLMPKPKKRSPGRPPKRGRPRKDTEKQANRDLLRKCRFLFLKRNENLTDDERVRIREAIDAFSRLGDESCFAALRALVLAVYELFGPSVRTPEDAQQRRAAILADPRYDLPFLAPLLSPLRDDAVFDRLIVSLSFENAERTTNHVERQNREYRKRQKSHYRLRTRRSEDALLSQMLFLPRRAPLRHPAGDQRLRPRPPPPRAATMGVTTAS